MYKRQVFVRTLGLWKKLTRLRQVVFDKTGTLTLENPMLMNPAVLDELDERARRMLRHLTSGNLHPVSRSLFDALGGMSSEGFDAEVWEEPGDVYKRQDLPLHGVFGAHLPPY